MPPSLNSFRKSPVLLIFLIVSIGTVRYVEADTWSPTGSMSTARAYQGATLLSDGRVLVSGGYDGNFILASAEIYDPALGSWSPTGSMNSIRYLHTATRLLDGRVLVTGGNSNSGYSSSAEVYDPALGTWAPTGVMSTARIAHTATLLPDGRVLVIGGHSGGNGIVASAEIYDPTLGTWSLTGSMSLPRHYHTATLLADGRVLVTGGSGGSGVIASAEIYDPAFGTWSATGSMSRATYLQTATLLPDGRVLVSGGLDGGNRSRATTELYDPGLGTWSLTGSMSTGRGYHAATLLSLGRVLVTGGYNFDDGGLATAELYNPALGTWTLIDSMTTARYLHKATLLSDGRILLSGGSSGFGVIASALIYTPDTTAPEVSCDASDGVWHATNVSLSCTAVDTDSGLADAADASFTLETTVSDDAESSNAFTTNRQVCDVAGNCAAAGPIGGNNVDRKAPVVNCATGDGLWHADNISLSCDSSDGGSGLAVAADASISLSTNLAAGLESADVSTGSHQVCDVVGNCSTAGPITGNKVDRKSPIVSCGAADSAWHNTDVSIACTANDDGSGLANAADASFNLTTSVTVGTETANAATNSRQVCNTVGDCTTANPITGNKVDKKPATISITSPAANATYQLNASVGANYACGDGGSGVASCQGTVGNGNLIDTSSTGTKTFTVTAADNVGNPSTLSVTYSVVSGGGGGQTSADVGVTLSAAARVSPGATLAYTIAVTNAGKVTPATGVVVSDALPAGTVFASASSSQGTITAPAVGSNGTVTVDIGSLAKGATATISVAVTVTAVSGTVLTNTATVTATTQDLNSNNNSATKKTTVSKN